MSTNSVLSLKNVSVRYGTQSVLENISLHAQRGVFYAVIGLNGSGKTSLFNALMNTIPYTGEIYLDQQDIKTLSAKALSKKISLLSQQNTVYAPLTVWEIVLMGRYPYTTLWQSYSEKDIEICKKALSLAQIEPFKDKKIHHLSGGEAQRVWLAQKIAQDTPILLLDEPTQHLDLKQKHLFFDLLRNILNREQKTILMSTHDLEELHKIQGNIWYLNHQNIETIENYTSKDLHQIKERLVQ